MTDRRTFLCEDFEISYEDTKKGWSMPYSHHHTNYEIYILLSGERLVTIGDITYRVKPAWQACLRAISLTEASVTRIIPGSASIFQKSILKNTFYLP